MSEENWKPVVGYEGYYEASDHGRVRSVDRQVEIMIRSKKTKMRFHAKMLTLDVCKIGYMRLGLSRDGTKKMHSVHRLVMAAFVGVSSMDVNHKDGDKRNNHLSNLEYCTESENMVHRYRMLGQDGLLGSRNAASVLEEEDIPAIRADKRKVKEIAADYGVTIQAIWAVKKRKTWAHVPECAEVRRMKKEAA